ncbi:hypothetical protein [Vibrio nomapromontoriensis]|uniref:tetratricopeptide repeat protein n=1 Tax=Vibrio nomapromontoriensis TaxID=2910246 RepID=UPI003D0B570A
MSQRNSRRTLADLPLAIVITMLILGYMPPLYAASNVDPIGLGIQLIQQGQLTRAKTQLATRVPPYQGEALFLAARIAEFEHNWSDAMSLYRRYLAEDPFSVHRLEARAAFALLRVYRNDPLLGDYLALMQLRDQNSLVEMQQVSLRLSTSNPLEALAIKGQLLVAHSLLELAQQPQQALQHYLEVIASTENMEADWYIQALFGAVFSALRDQKPAQAKQFANQLQAKLDSSWGSRNSLLARSWQQRLDAMAFIFELQQDTRTTPSEPFLWGVGARLLLDHPVGSGQNYAPVWETLSANQLDVQSVTLWITQHSDWNWLRSDLLRGAHQHGYIPMINYWFFGDQISPDYVQANRQRYLDEIKNKLIPLLRDLPQAYLILEPEFNKQGIETWDGWDPLMLEVIALIRKHAPQIKVGLGLGDWDQPGSTPSYNSAQKSIEASDFVASMLMLSSYTERAHSAPDWSAWIRALRLGEQLQKRFNKPWMLAYLSIASQPNWQAQQANELDKLTFYLPMLRQLGLFALNWFSLTDEPNQTGWFSDAEQSFGLLDANYQAKTALATYRQLTAQNHANHSAPQLKQFTLKKQADNLLPHWQVDATWTHWSRWELRISQGSNTWTTRGAGDGFSLNWNGQMLPIWAESGTVIISLKLNNQSVKHVTTSWKRSALSLMDINEQVNLATWHTWQKLPWRPLEPTVLGQPNSGSFELVVTGLNSQRLNGLYIGFIDQNGFYQMLSASGYAYQIGEETAIYIPLSDFKQSWVKYDKGMPIWRKEAAGSPAIVLQNNSQQPLSFRVKTMQFLLPENQK